MTTRDLVEPDSTHDERYYILRTWADDFDMSPMFLSYHRLQIERFVFDTVARLRPFCVADIAQDEAPRVWLKGEGFCEDYKTLGRSKECDVYLDLLRDPAATISESYDCVICTEVLEHVKNPFRSAKTVYKLLKSGGVLIGATPFCWADHHTDKYDDYWRFTAQGLELLLEDFEDVSIRGVEWTSEGAQLYDFLRRFEGYGVRAETYMCTGFLFTAKKGETK